VWRCDEFFVLFIFQVKAPLRMVNMVQSLSDDRREESLQDRVLLTTLYLLVGGTLSLMWILSWLFCEVVLMSEKDLELWSLSLMCQYLIQVSGHLHSTHPTVLASWFWCRRSGHFDISYALFWFSLHPTMSLEQWQMKVLRMVVPCDCDCTSLGCRKS